MVGVGIKGNRICNLEEGGYLQEGREPLLLGSCVWRFPIPERTGSSQDTIVLALPLLGCVALSKSLYLSGLFCKIRLLVYISKILSNSERKRIRVSDSMKTEKKLNRLD